MKYYYLIVGKQADGIFEYGTRIVHI